MDDPRAVANVHILASMPADKLRNFLQCLQDFDAKHLSEIPFEVVVSSPSMSVDQIRAIFASIRPPVPYRGRVRLGGWPDWQPDDG